MRPALFPDFDSSMARTLERYDRYEGKKIHFTARAYKMKGDDEFQFVSGRYIMTCCAADLTFVGMISSYFKAYELENKEWVNVTGIIKVVYDSEMKRKVPVCRVIELEKAEQPEEEIISLL